MPRATTTVPALNRLEPAPRGRAWRPDRALRRGASIWSTTPCTLRRPCAISASTGCAICWNRNASGRCSPRDSSRASRRRKHSSALETNLPMQLTTLVGREAEIAHISAMIEREGDRLVTLTGPGGTGKTRLALAVAAEALDAFPDGVWFVDLAPLTDPALVLPAIASVLGVREPGGRLLPDHRGVPGIEAAAPGPRQFRAGPRRSTASSPRC